MSDPTWALQKALYAALDAALACAVYDAVPQDAAFPYVTLDTEVSEDAGFLSERMERRHFYLNVWSRYPGQKEVKEIIAQIGAALHEKPLTLETGAAVSVRVVRANTSRDADGATFMGQVTLRIYTTH